MSEGVSELVRARMIEAFFSLSLYMLLRQSLVSVFYSECPCLLYSFSTEVFPSFVPSTRRVKPRGSLGSSIFREQFIPRLTLFCL